MANRAPLPGAPRRSLDLARQCDRSVPNLERLSDDFYQPPCHVSAPPVLRVVLRNSAAPERDLDVSVLMPGSLRRSVARNHPDLALPARTDVLAAFVSALASEALVSCMRRRRTVQSAVGSPRPPRQRPRIFAAMASRESCAKNRPALGRDSGVPRRPLHLSLESKQWRGKRECHSREFQQFVSSSATVYSCNSWTKPRKEEE